MSKARGTVNVSSEICKIGEESASLGDKATKNPVFHQNEMIVISTKSTKITRPETMKFRCESDEETKEPQRKNKRKKVPEESSSDEVDEEEDYDDEEEG